MHESEELSTPMRAMSERRAAVDRLNVAVVGTLPRAALRTLGAEHLVVTLGCSDDLVESRAARVFDVVVWSLECSGVTLADGLRRVAALAPIDARRFVLVASDHDALDEAGQAGLFAGDALVVWNPCDAEALSAAVAAAGRSGHD